MILISKTYEVILLTARTPTNIIAPMASRITIKKNISIVSNILIKGKIFLLPPCVIREFEPEFLTNNPMPLRVVRTARMITPVFRLKQKQHP